MKFRMRLQRLPWIAIIFLVLIGVFAVLRRTVHLAPILVNGYPPPVAAPNPMARQLLALDDIFARYPGLTPIHILPALLFLVIAPLQFY